MKNVSFTLQKKTYGLFGWPNSLFSSPRSPGNHCSTFWLWIWLPGYLIQVASYSICPFVSGLFPLAEMSLPVIHIVACVSNFLFGEIH